MVFYDARPLRLAGQVLLDLIVVAGLVMAVVLGTVISTSISALAAIGTRVHEDGDAFQTQLSKAAQALRKVPFAGDAVSSPVREAAKDARSIAAAGAQQHDATIQLAHLVGTGVAVALILALLLIWARYRGGFIRAATAVRRLQRSGDGTELLAVRALVTRNAAAKLGEGVVERWRRGDPDTIHALADLERRASGLPAARFGAR
ncbi:hypothetical protein [Gryllotalpicola ginsengisoli]|uniref:hypothetical protein n=1 Tax=Gryllotalpicola ginsengisoli TaxID=444608 RepID=UPI0003B59348|nr:hypothetical protein [Gryllotalpicola ginsengisoli]